MEEDAEYNQLRDEELLFDQKELGGGPPSSSNGNGMHNHDYADDTRKGGLQMTFGVQESLGGQFNNNLSFGNGQPLGALNLKNLDELDRKNNGANFGEKGYGSDGEQSVEKNIGSQKLSNYDEEELKNDLSVEILNNFDYEQAPNTPVNGIVDNSAELPLDNQMIIASPPQTRG